MIYGIGTDICRIKRFEKWINNPFFLSRFFNAEEIVESNNPDFLCEHYASRFASKEAFSKALGTGIVGFNLREIYVKKDQRGKPYFCFSQELRDKIEKMAGSNFKIHLTISHEKDYAVSFVVIESDEDN